MRFSDGFFTNGLDAFALDRESSALSSDSDSSIRSPRHALINPSPVDKPLVTCSANHSLPSAGSRTHLSADHEVPFRPFPESPTSTAKSRNGCGVPPIFHMQVFPNTFPTVTNRENNIAAGCASVVGATARMTSPAQPYSASSDKTGCLWGFVDVEVFSITGEGIATCDTPTVGVPTTLAGFMKTPRC
jgi:hypothetical protein